MNKQKQNKLRGIRSTQKLKRVERLLEEHKYVYTCQYCRVKFAQNSHFFRHMTTNHAMQQKDATFECDTCQIVFAKKALLDFHCQTHHQAKSKFRCESCSITFKSRYCLRRHMKLKQTLQENACAKCEKKCMDKYLLDKHIDSKHATKNVCYSCDLCSLYFKAPESLKIHTVRVHTQRKL